MSDRRASDQWRRARTGPRADDREVTDGEESVRRARAEARRAKMIIARGTLGDEVDLTPVRGAEGVALVAGVSAAAWVFAGNTLPAPWQHPLLVEFRRRGE